MSETVVTTPAAPAAPVPAAPSAPATGTPAATETPSVETKAESAPAAQPDGEKKSDTDENPERRSHRRFERRIDRLTKRAAEAQARAELYERELQQYKQPKAEAGEPKLEDFKDITEWGEALAKHRSEKALKEHQAKQQTETQKQAQARLVQGWEEKVARGESRYDDWEDVVGEVKPNSPMAVAVMRAPNGDEIAYHLGKNLKEAHRIAALDPVDQFLEIGLLSAKLAAEPPKPKVPSKAPAPITPVTGTAPANSAEPQDSDDIRTWIKKRQKQVHGARR